MYCRFYLLVNTPILYSLPGLSQQPSPTASPLKITPHLCTPSTSKWELFSFVCLVAQPCQSCDINEGSSEVFGVGPASTTDSSLPSVSTTLLAEHFLISNDPTEAIASFRPRTTKKDASDIWWHARPLKVDTAPVGEWPDASTEPRWRTKPPSKEYPYTGCKLCT
jgi:hypothetical protein